MNSSVRLIALLLGLIAFLLMGYALYSERQVSAELRETVEYQQDRIGSYQNVDRQRSVALQSYLSSENGSEKISQIAAAPSEGQRSQLAAEASREILFMLADSGAANWRIERFQELVQEDEPAKRTAMANELTDTVDPVVESPVVIVDEALATVSTLVAVLGSVGSALTSAFLFVTGGRRRRIEEEMLALDLEKQKIELTQMRFEAREAIAATKPIQERSLT